MAYGTNIIDQEKTPIQDRNQNHNSVEDYDLTDAKKLLNKTCGFGGTETKLRRDISTSVERQKGYKERLKYKFLNSDYKI